MLIAAQKNTRGTEAPDAERRVFPRHKVGERVRIKNGGQSAWEGYLTDLSATGFGIETQCHIYIDQPVYLLIEGMQPLRGMVRWSEYRSYGCEFERPLYEPVLEHLLDLLRV